MMRSSTKVWALGFVVLVALGAAGSRWLRAVPGPRASAITVTEGAAEAPPSKLAAPANVSEAESAELKRALSALRAEVGSLREENQRAQRDFASAKADVPVAPSPEEQEQRFLAEVAKVDQGFRDEPRDHAWSESMVTQIRAAADGLPAGFVQDIDCRSRTCKLELGALDARAQEPAVEALILKLAGVLPHATMGHDGNLSAPKVNALYLGLPSPDDYLPPVARQ